MGTRTWIARLALLCALGATACDGSTSPPEPDAQLLAVFPAGGSIGVSVSTNVTLTFTHSMMWGMEAYAAIHEGAVTGPLVAGTWSWADDRRSLTFTPAAPLRAATLYTIHLGGGLMTSSGQPIGIQRHGLQMGGQWMNGGMGPGAWGPGWRHPNGTNGMTFTFTTA